VNQQSAAALLGVLLLAPTAPLAAQQPPDLPHALVRVEPSATVTLLDTDAYSQLVQAMGSFPERRIEGRFRPQGVASLVGGGVRVGVTPKISIRPEVIWYPQPGGGERSAPRASVGVGFRW
jgi:hypothetical protein